MTLRRLAKGAVVCVCVLVYVFKCVVVKLVLRACAPCVVVFVT